MATSQTVSRFLLVAAVVAGAGLGTLTAVDFAGHASRIATHWPATTQDWRTAALDEALPSHGLAAQDEAFRTTSFAPAHAKTPVIVSAKIPIVGQSFTYTVGETPARTMAVTGIRLLTRSDDKMLLAVTGDAVPATRDRPAPGESLLVEVPNPQKSANGNLHSL